LPISRSDWSVTVSSRRNTNRHSAPMSHYSVNQQHHTHKSHMFNEKTGEVYADMTKIFNQSVVRRTNTQRKR
jgi:hypothetical protein